MNIPSAAASAANTAAASVAGTSRAAAKGGAADQTAIDAQAAAHKTATGGVEKTEAAAKADMDADRDADGRQVWDVFDRSEDRDSEDPEAPQADAEEESAPQDLADDSPKHLDLEM